MKTHKKIIAFRFFDWSDPDPDGRKDVAGNPVRLVRHASFGEEVEIPDDQIARGEELGAFFSDEDAEAIRAGTYSGPVAHLLPGQRRIPQAAEGDVIALGDLDVANADAAEIAAYIQEHKLTVGDTVALAGDDKDLAEKILDAEEIATQGSPRAGVEKGIEAVMSRANQ